MGEVLKEIIQSETEYVSCGRQSNHEYRPHGLWCTDTTLAEICSRGVLIKRIGTICNSIIILNQYSAYLFIWLRYSFNRQLTWQKSYNTKPKDLQWAQVTLTDEICGLYSRLYGKDRETFLSSADLLRQMLSMIGKGSGNGQRVRDDILHIMHKHKIPESAGHFYE